MAAPIPPTEKVCVHCESTYVSTDARQKSCSDRCRRAFCEEKNRVPCIDCGTRLSAGSGWKKRQRCVECYVAHCARARRKKNARLVELWNAGHPLKEMARILGTTPGTVSVQMARAKKEGYEFPFRRAGWKGHTSPNIGAKSVEPKTNRQVVERMHHAIRYGRLSRPDQCERCGKKCHPDGHHHDYSKPLDVEWLCRSCHMTHHAAERKAAA